MSNQVEEALTAQLDRTPPTGSEPTKISWLLFDHVVYYKHVATENRRGAGRLGGA